MASPYQVRRVVREPVRETVEEDNFWEEPLNLQAPPPRPGYVQKWARVAVGADADATNVARLAKGGWTPRPADTCEGFVAVKGGDFNGCIGVHGMVLMEQPVELAGKRQQLIRNRVNKLTMAVDKDLGVFADSQVQLHDERTFHRGRQRITPGR